MNKAKAIAIDKVNSTGKYQLIDTNTHFANINNKAKSVWWIEIPVFKFKYELYLLLCYEVKNLILIQIPANNIDSPADVFRIRNDNNKVHLEICSDAADTKYMKDTLGSAKVDFRKYIVETFVNIL